MSDPFFKTRDEIQTWLWVNNVTGYTIRDDLTVDVDRDVYLDDLNLFTIPVRFGIVDGDFRIEKNNLTSLVGSPDKCKYFDCSNNHLTRLIGAPADCNTLKCSRNRLVCLDFGNTSGCKHLLCSNNQLTTLNGTPTGCVSVLCRNNPALADISGAPDGCEIEYDHDVVAKNRAVRQLAALDPQAPDGDVLKPKPGRIL